MDGYKEGRGCGYPRKVQRLGCDGREVRSGATPFGGGRRRNSPRPALSRQLRMDENLQVIDVFDSQQSLDALGKTLLPILNEMGITAQPEIQEVYKIVKG